jgi:murein DD-endopeptidase MepM/ murein hydrolase activator NlpD
MRLVFLSLCLLLPLAMPAQQATIETATQDHAVHSGSPFVVHVTGLGRGTATVTGRFMDKQLTFFPDGNGGQFALLGADVETNPGRYRLTLLVNSPRIGEHDLSLTVPVLEAHYRTAKLSVEPGFVEPNPAEKAQIATDQKLKDAAFARASDGRLWQANFAAPVQAAATDSFGTRRIFNGKLASIHKGQDYRAASGTAVHAANDGTVLLAASLYYEGNCVIVDHGAGLVTLYMHLSHFNVKTGEHITKGQLLGLSGATGRVTGPHLHFAVRWQGAYLDPAQLLKLKLP